MVELIAGCGAFRERLVGELSTGERMVEFTVTPMARDQVGVPVEHRAVVASYPGNDEATINRWTCGRRALMPVRLSRLRWQRSEARVRWWTSRSLASATSDSAPCARIHPQLHPAR